MSDLAQRRLTPEILDELPAADPRAVHSRRDLRRLNALMGHAGILAKALTPLVGNRPSLRIIELGAGDGTFLLDVARRLPGVRAEARLIDRQPLLSPATSEAFAALGWHVQTATADVFDWLGKRTGPPADVILANLFLHHFEGERLRTLLALMAANAHAALACEPRRARLPLAATRLVGLVGCNDVTRHDARVSVEAGFTNNEVSRVWPATGWSTQEGRAGLFSHRFMARRNSTA